MKNVVLITSLAIALSGCATLEEFSIRNMSFLPQIGPQVQLPEIPASPSDEFVAADLVSAVDGRVDKDTQLAIISNRSTAWEPVEDHLRKRGYAVTTVPKLRGMQQDFHPVYYTLAEIDEDGMLYGHLRVGSQFEAARLYQGDDYIILNASSMTIKSQGAPGYE